MWSLPFRNSFKFFAHSHKENPKNFSTSSSLRFTKPLTVGLFRLLGAFKESHHDSPRISASQLGSLRWASMCCPPSNVPLARRTAETSGIWSQLPLLQTLPNEAKTRHLEHTHSFEALINPWEGHCGGSAVRWNFATWFSCDCCVFHPRNLPWLDCHVYPSIGQ